MTDLASVAKENSMGTVSCAFGRLDLEPLFESVFLRSALALLQEVDTGGAAKVLDGGIGGGAYCCLALRVFV